MLFPLESVSHLPDSNIAALDQDDLFADAGGAARADWTTFSDDASHQPGLELGLALSLAFVINTIIAPRRAGQAFAARG